MESENARLGDGGARVHLGNVAGARFAKRLFENFEVFYIFGGGGVAVMLQARENQIHELAPRLARIAVERFVRFFGAENLAQVCDAVAQDFGHWYFGFGEAQAAPELTQALAGYGQG